MASIPSASAPALQKQAPNYANIAGGIPFRNIEFSGKEAHDQYLQQTARARYMDGFNKMPMKLANSCYPEPLFLPDGLDLTEETAKRKARTLKRAKDDATAEREAVMDALVNQVRKTFKDAYSLDVDVCHSNHGHLPGEDFKPGQKPQKLQYSYKSWNVFHCKRCWNAGKYSPIFVCQFVKDKVATKHPPSPNTTGKTGNNNSNKERPKPATQCRTGIKFWWLVDHSSQCQDPSTEKLRAYMSSKQADLGVHYYNFQDTYDALVDKVNKHCSSHYGAAIRNQFNVFNQSAKDRPKPGQKKKSVQYPLYKENYYAFQIVGIPFHVASRHPPTYLCLGMNHVEGPFRSQQGNYLDPRGSNDKFGQVT
jgi:hypothetical protein